jgi:hypothetical protein
MQTILQLFRILVLLVLLLLWACNVPNHPVSDFVGANFPWPTQKSLRWPGLLAEGALIHFAIALPFSLLLAFVFRNWSVRVAIALAAIFTMRAFFELPSPIAPPYGTIFLFYLVGCHVVLLVGLTTFARRLLSRSNRVAGGF